MACPSYFSSMTNDTRKGIDERPLFISLLTRLLSFVNPNTEPEKVWPDHQTIPKTPRKHQFSGCGVTKATNHQMMIISYCEPLGFQNQGVTVPTDKFQFWKLLLFQKMPACQNKQKNYTQIWSVFKSRAWCFCKRLQHFPQVLRVNISKIFGKPTIYPSLPKTLSYLSLSYLGRDRYVFFTSRHPGLNNALIPPELNSVLIATFLWFIQNHPTFSVSLGPDV